MKFNLVKSLRKDDALGAFFYSRWQLVPDVRDHVRIWTMKESTIIWSLYNIKTIASKIIWCNSGFE